MKHITQLCIILMTCSIVLVGTSAVSAAEEQISWWVIGNGPTSAASTNYSLGGTPGQIGTGAATSTNYTIHEGFWQNLNSSSCCEGTTGNVTMVGIVDLSDLSLLIAYLTVPAPGKPSLPCPEEANITGVGIIDLSDLSLLIAYLTVPVPDKPVLPNCP